ncbi:Trehalose/maltose import ATP-binding protein MalK [uncultured archaeon]|nr:Trehalose/maltose import ATP-binding protein MalK [uncultured archaeon]
MLDDISFSISEHEFVCVLGPSGCGKSTLLRMVAGLDTPTTGHALFRGREISGPNPKASAMIFQTFALLPWRTVYENIELGLQSIGTPKEKRTPIITKYIKLMDLEDFSDAYPYELSGGMKQRVGIARALAVEPAVLLMDEPFSALDAMTADQLRKDVLEIWNDSKTITNTFMMITHLIDEAVLMADRVIVLSKRPGKVIGDIPIDIPRPRHDHMRDPEFYEMCDMIRRMISYSTGEVEKK